MTIKSVEFKLARSAEEIAERISQVSQDLRAGYTASDAGELYWICYRGECEVRLSVLLYKRVPDDIPFPTDSDDEHYMNLYYAALAESMWLYGLKNTTHVPLPGTNYSTESYL